MTDDLRKKGFKKQPRTKIRMELFNSDNPQHIQIMKELNTSPLSGEMKTLLQFYNNKPAGYANFVKEGKEMYVQDVFVLPEYRDTIKIPENEIPSKKAKAEKNFNTFVRTISRFGNKLNDVPLSRRKSLEQLDRQRGRIIGRSEMKRKNQLFLAAKMFRWIAKKYGLPTSAVGNSIQGEHVIDKYSRKYDEYFFKKRGQHKIAKTALRRQH